MFSRVEDILMNNPTIPQSRVEDLLVQLMEGMPTDEHIRDLVGSPLKADTVSEMTDDTKIYIYTGSETGYTAGHWYYYNGSSWADGGVYNSAGINTDKTLSVEDKAADGKAVGDALSQLNGDLSELEGDISQTPKVRNSTKTGVDFDITDDDGNVIVRLSNGHIQTKEFDSSDMDNKLDSDQGSANAGKFLRVESDGSVQPEEINIPTSSASVSTSTAQADFDVADGQGNIILRIKNGFVKSKNFDSESLNPKVITVNSNGTGDYTSIRAAIEAASTAGASSDDRYHIEIAPGSYDILSEFTSTEIAASGFVGLTVTDGITLVGTGTLREQVVLYAEMDTTTYDDTKRNKVSTINFYGDYCGLKNLVVKSKNMRYAVHDDTGIVSNKQHFRVLEKCTFYAETTTSGGYGNISYGAGTDGNKVFIFRDCDFSDCVHVHTNTQAKPNTVFMYGCRGFGFTASDYASSVDNHYYLNDSVFQFVALSKGSDWVSQHLFIHGTIKGAMVSGWEGMYYELGDSMRYQHPNISAYPRAVTMLSTGRQRIGPASTADATVGICYYYDSTADIALVQHDGFICAELLGFSSAEIGQYLNVGSGGVLSLSSSDTNAIGKVKYLNNNGKHFIKLSI